MLAQDIAEIINYIRSKGSNPAEPTCTLAAMLLEAEDIARTNFLVYDFELNTLFFANTGASSFLGVTKTGMKEYEGVFLESIIHPSSYQLLINNARLLKPTAGSFDGVLYLKTSRKSKYAWVSASAMVVGFTPAGIPKLVYISFVEVEKAMQCYLKLLQCESKAKEDTPSFELIASLNNREVELLSLIAAECTSKEIADVLNVSQSAVDSARKRLIKKLKVKSVVGLVKAAMSLGLTENDMLAHTGAA